MPVSLEAGKWGGEGDDRWFFSIPNGSYLTACRGCGADVVWGKSKAGKSVPLTFNARRYVTFNGVVDLMAPSHFTDCPQAADFRRKR